MRIVILFIFLFLFQQTTSRPQTIQRFDINKVRQKCPFRQCCCCSHFVYALDESGSMRGVRWNTLRNTMNYIGNNLGDNFGKHYMTTYEFDSIARSPNFYHRRPSLFNSAILHLNGGGTNFNKALLRGISIISGYLYENTCFNLITDGMSSWSHATANLFNAILQRVRRNGCRACAYCYFIKRYPNSKVPAQFRNLCKKIGATLRHVQPNQFAVVFGRDQRAAVARLSA